MRLQPLCDVQAEAVLKVGTSRASRHVEALSQGCTGVLVNLCLQRQDLIT